MTLNEQWDYEPARDLGLTHRQAMRSTLREPGIVGCVTTWLWWCVAGTYLKWRQRLEVRGAERLPAEPPFVLVANHSSHFDALVLGAAVPARMRHQMFPIAAGDTFFQTPVTATMSALMLNALPMWRRNCGAHALKVLRQRLADRRIGLILFPEGTRSRDGQMGRFKAGIGMIVAGTDVPVVPCHIAGAHESWPPDRRRPARGRITVRIGEMMSFESAENRRRGWEHVAADLEEAVRILCGPASPATQEEA